MYKLAHVYHT